MLEYARFVDSGHAAGIADLFSVDGEWLGADGRGMNGRDEIRKAFTGRQALTRRQSRHVMTNVLIDIDGPDTAHGIAYLINFRHDSDGPVAAHPAPADHPKFVGDYHLTFGREGDRWQILTLRFDLAFLRRRKDA
jgi:hypothetical protein